MKRLKVLMYHRIIPDNADPSVHAVRRSDFRQHLRLLDEMGFEPVTFLDLHEILQGRLSAPSKPVVITFDDGYLDVHDLAFPELERMGWPAVVFALGDPSVRTSRWDASTPSGAHPLMNDSHLRLLAGEGIEIGSHTLTHPDLTAIGMHEAWREVGQSKMRLEQRLGREVSSFSYPYGRLNGSIRALAAASGYRVACGVYTGPGAFGADLHDVRRLTVSGLASPFHFVNMMRLPFAEFQSLRHRLLRSFRTPPEPLPTATTTFTLSESR